MSADREAPATSSTNTPSNTQRFSRLGHTAGVAKPLIKVPSPKFLLSDWSKVTLAEAAVHLEWNQALPASAGIVRRCAGSAVDDINVDRLWLSRGAGTGEYLGAGTTYDNASRRERRV